MVFSRKTSEKWLLHLYHSSFFETHRRDPNYTVTWTAPVKNLQGSILPTNVIFTSEGAYAGSALVFSSPKRADGNFLHTDYWKVSDVHGTQWNLIVVSTIHRFQSSDASLQIISFWPEDGALFKPSMANPFALHMHAKDDWRYRKMALALWRKTRSQHSVYVSLRIA